MHNTGIALGGIDPTFDYIVGLLAPKKVLLTSKQYSGFSEMRRDYTRTGYLRINVEHSDNTIFGSKMVNWQFRAWHDLCHIQGNADFSPKGESHAARLQIEQLNHLFYYHRAFNMSALGRWTMLIDCEVNGQGEFFQQHGEFPNNQREFTREWLLSRYRVDSDSFPKTLDGFTVKW